MGETRGGSQWEDTWKSWIRGGRDRIGGRGGSSFVSVAVGGDGPEHASLRFDVSSSVESSLASSLALTFDFSLLDVVDAFLQIDCVIVCCCLRF